MPEVRITDQTIISIDDMEFYDLVDRALLARVNQLTTYNLAQDQTTIFYQGKQGVNIDAIDQTKNITVTATNGFFDLGVLSLQTGKDVEIYDGATKFMQAPQLDQITTADGTTAITTQTAFGTAGAEIEYVYKLNGSGIVGATKYTQAATADATHFSYDPETKTITLPTGVFTANELIIAQYKYKAYGTAVSSDTQHFSKYANVIVNFSTRDICTKAITHSQVEIYNGKISGSFSMAAGDNPTVHNIEITAMPNICFSATQNLFEYRLVNPYIEEPAAP